MTFSQTFANRIIYGGNIICSGQSSTIKDNLIINGHTTGSWGGYGGGIYLSTSADFSKIINNIIQDNWAWASGGGIHTAAEGVTIEGNIIYNNDADRGGGVQIEGESTVFRKNIVDDNYTELGGGGVRVLASGAFIENNTIVNNSATPWGDAGAMSILGVNEITIRNNIFAFNRTSYTTGGVYFSSCPITLTFTYNDFYDNSGNDYSNCVPGTGSIFEDPLFVDPLSQDYHLQLDSPAIDAGDPAPEFNDQEDPSNPGFALYPAMGLVRNDMGAYGGPIVKYSTFLYLPIITKS